MMKLFFDSQIFSWQKSGGISRYYSEVIPILINKLKCRVYIPIVFSRNIYSRKTTIFNRSLRFSLGNSVNILINKLVVVYRMLFCKYDIFHPTYYDPYFLNYVGNHSLVITVYDMIHEIYPEYFPRDKTTKWKKLLTDRADQIIAISQSTADDLVRIFNIDKEKINVVYLATSIHKLKKKKLRLPKKYLLYVGDRANYKNFDVLIKAMSEIMLNNASLHVVCIGGGKFTQTELSLFGMYQSRYHQMMLTDPQLAYSYSKAECLVITSLYEGFGLPLLEAMQCGCPVISSDTSSLPEVGGKAPIYFSPKDVKALVSCINVLTTNPKKRNEMIQAGYKQAKKFSWQKCATQTYNVYKKAMKN